MFRLALFFGLSFFLLSSHYVSAACSLGDEIIQKRTPDSGPSDAISGVAILVHGLNQNPEMMNFLRDILLERNYITLRLSLQGHFEQSADEEMSEIKDRCWDDQLKYVLSRSDQLLKKYELNQRIFLGFSLGGALGVRHLALNPKVFDKMFLFAPALEFRPTSYLVTLLDFLDENITIPTITDPSERAAKGSSLKAYRELFRVQSELQDGLKIGYINIPTIVFVHEKDELISPEGIQNFINRNQLENWELQIIQSSKSFGLRRYYHQISVPDHINYSVWQEQIGLLLNEKL